MKHGFLEPTDPNAFLDWPKPKPVPLGKHLCINCKGYGGWNLKVNANPMSAKQEADVRNMLKEATYSNMPLLKHDMSDSLFRHYYVHLRAGCHHCNGWGYTELEDTDHVHDFSITENVSMFLHKDICSICGKSKMRDSS
jgi:hypothetical protein